MPRCVEIHFSLLLLHACFLFKFREQELVHSCKSPTTFAYFSSLLEWKTLESDEVLHERGLLLLSHPSLQDCILWDSSRQTLEQNKVYSFQVLHHDAAFYLTPLLSQS